MVTERVYLDSFEPCLIQNKELWAFSLTGPIHLKGQSKQKCYVVHDEPDINVFCM